MIIKFTALSIALLSIMTLIAGCGGTPPQTISPPANLQPAPAISSNSASKMLFEGDSWSFVGKEGRIEIFVQSKDRLVVNIKSLSLDVKKQNCNINLTETQIG